MRWKKTYAHNYIGNAISFSFPGFHAFVFKSLVHRSLIAYTSYHFCRAGKETILFQVRVTVKYLIVQLTAQSGIDSVWRDDLEDILAQIHIRGTVGNPVDLLFQFLLLLPIYLKPAPWQ